MDRWVRPAVPNKKKVVPSRPASRASDAGRKPRRATAVFIGVAACCNLLLALSVGPLIPSACVAQPQDTLAVSNATAAPGTVAIAPVVLELASGVVVATIQFNLTVVPLGTAPALDMPISFSHSLLPPRQGPNLTENDGNATALVGWLSQIAPALSFQVQIGAVTVPIPATAQIGDRYTVEVRSPSATSDGATEVPLDGIAGEIEVVESATPTQTATQTTTPLVTATSTPTATRTPTQRPSECVGDCDGSGEVTVNEIITMVNIALGNADVAACVAGDQDGSREITIDEIIAAVNHALNGCP